MHAWVILTACTTIIVTNLAIYNVQLLLCNMVPKGWADFNIISLGTSFGNTHQTTHKDKMIWERRLGTHFYPQNNTNISNRVWKRFMRNLGTHIGNTRKTQKEHKRNTARKGTKEKERKGKRNKKQQKRKGTHWEKEHFDGKVWKRNVWKHLGTRSTEIN